MITEQPEILRAALSKVYMEMMLSKEMLCEECVSDISFEFARQTIDDDDMREKWTSIWSRYAPRIKISPVLGYDPVNAYQWLYSIAGERGLNFIVRDLTYRAKNEIPLSLEEYLKYFSMRFKRFENILDMTELKIISHLLEDCTYSITDLAKHIDLSTEWVSKKVTDLRNRHILREFTRIPFSKIKIDMAHLIIKRAGGIIDPFILIKDCPFLYSYRQVLAGPWDSIGTLCIPNNPKSIDYLKKGLDLISKCGFETNIHDIRSSGVSTSFDFYRENEGWDIPWELMSVQLDRILKDDLAQAFPRVDKPQASTTLSLTKFDMQIVECILNGINSVASIRTELRVGQERLATRLRELRDSGLIATIWEAHNIGLHEHVFVCEVDPRTSEAISGWTQRLPRSIISFSERGDLSMQVDLPAGGSYGFSLALEDATNMTQVAILSPKIYGVWGFPIDLWDPRYQKWSCPENALVDWIARIRSSE